MRHVRSDDGLLVGLVQALVPVLLAACGGQNLVVRDTGAIFPTFRTTFLPSSRGPAPEDDPGAPGPRTTWRSNLEFALSGVDDSADNRDYEMLEYSLAYRGGALVRKRWTFDGMIGLGYNDLDIQPLPGTSKQNHDYYGLLVGAEIGFAATHKLGFYFRYTGLTTGVDRSGQREVGVSYSLTRVVRLFGGWRRWDLEIENAGLGPAGTFEIDLRTEGIVLGLGLDF